MDAQSKLKSAQAELSQLQDDFEGEQESKGHLQKQLTSAKNDAASWKNRFDNEATPKIEELEDGK